MKCPSCFVENEEAAENCFACGQDLGAALKPGSILASRYEILSPLGKGGMGMVYKAHDRVLEEDIAIKVLRADVARSPDMARRFRSEIRLARKVTHRNVCRIHEYGEDQGRRYISMELIEGVDLKQVIRERKSGLPVTEAFDVSTQVAKGLQAIHDVGIIHRDLKTANIMRDRRGFVKLMDFGIAKEENARSTSATAAGDIVGTPEYMSPEQARGLKVDTRSDIYALAIVIYEIFSGDVPFRGETPIVTIFKHIQDQPRLEGKDAPAFPASLIEVLRRGLEKDPEQRYASAEEVVEALRAARIGAREPAAASEPGGPSPALAPSPFTTTPVPDAPPARPPAAARGRRAEQPTARLGAAQPAVTPAPFPSATPATPPPVTPTPQPASEQPGDTAATHSLEARPAPLEPPPEELPPTVEAPRPEPSAPAVWIPPTPPVVPEPTAATPPAAREAPSPARPSGPVRPPPPPAPEAVRVARQQTQRLPAPPIAPPERTRRSDAALPPRRLLVPLLVAVPLLLMIGGVLLVGRLIRSITQPQEPSVPPVSAAAASPAAPTVVPEVVVPVPAETPPPAAPPSLATAAPGPPPTPVPVPPGAASARPPTPHPSVAPTAASPAAPATTLPPLPRATPRPSPATPAPTPPPAAPSAEQLRVQQLASHMAAADAAFASGRYDEAGRLYDETLKLDAANQRAAAGKARALWATQAIRRVFVVGRTVNLPLSTGKGPAGFDTVDVEVKTQDFMCDIGVEISPPAVRPGGPYDYVARLSLKNIGKKTIKIRSVQAVVTLNGTRSEETLQAATREVSQKQQLPLAEATGSWKEEMSQWSLQVVVTGEKGDVCRSTTNWRQQ